MPDHATHTSHVEWVRAAVRDQLGITDEGGTVTLDRDGLTRLAEVARRETLNWVVAAAKNGQIEHSGDSDV